MTRAQRIVSILYCLLVACCCIWVPWHSISVVTGPNAVIPEENEKRVTDVRLGYDWVWTRQGPAFKLDESGSSYAGESNTIILRLHQSATPNLVIIALSLLAATALGSAAFLLAGKWRSP